MTDPLAYTHSCRQYRVLQKTLFSQGKWHGVWVTGGGGEHSLYARFNSSQEEGDRISEEDGVCFYQCSVYYKSAETLYLLACRWRFLRVVEI